MGGAKLLKRISRHEPHDRFTKINQTKLPILTIHVVKMLAQFDMNKIKELYITNSYRLA